MLMSESGIGSFRQLPGSGHRILFEYVVLNWYEIGWADTVVCVYTKGPLHATESNKKGEVVNSLRLSTKVWNSMNDAERVEIANNLLSRIVQL